MKNNSRQLQNWILLGLGLVLITTSIFRYFQSNDKLIPSIGIAVALLIFTTAANKIIGNLALRNAPKERRQIDIETNDERNIIIRDKAAAHTNKIMKVALFILMLILAFIKAQIWIISIAASLIIFQSVINLVLYLNYDKKL